MGLLAIWVRRSELITHPGGLSHLRHYSGDRTSEHQGQELRSEAARNVHGSLIGRQSRHPVECAAVHERSLESFARTCCYLKPQALVVVRMFQEARSTMASPSIATIRSPSAVVSSRVNSVMRRSGKANPCCSR